ncbi:hypothetical protein [Paraburkholderia domus]|uniref:hypothetical protein n=1 Tax=Paraburkholderia domus TaxID=2793075 RepID=UPI001B1858BE|nr:hypothetical protein [Paraburkholderia domus]CAE6825902.1 hypothetical protein R75483_06474 [Paraburkholderia domus]
MRRLSWFWVGCVALLACAWLLTRLVTNEYVFFAGEVVLQFIALATALVLSLIEQGLTVTVSPELNLLAIGLILVGGVVFLPGGLYRLLSTWKRPRREMRAAQRRRTA